MLYQAYKLAYICTVCGKRLPSKCMDVTDIYKRIYSDKHVPKLYSADNNMDLGSIPPDLTLSAGAVIAYPVLFCGNASNYICSFMLLCND